MKKRNPYSYSILRYVHDTATAEFVNVGVALHCPSESFFQVSCRSTLGRVSEVFPDIQTTAFRSLMRGLSKRFSALSTSYSSPLDLEDKQQDLEVLLRSVLPKDDSALMWSSVSRGLTSDARKTLTDLFARYVTKYDHKTVPHKRTDDDVWKDFRKGLENRHIDTFFDEKVIEGKDDEIKFKSAWKNGIWHCVEPISFDLSAPENIKEKAHKFLGQVTSVAASNTSFKVYLVVGKPTDKNLTSALENAVGILQKLPVQKEIYMEDQRESLLDTLSAQIYVHENRPTDTNH